ncbi:iron-sulfur cluster carrier protein ApbC [Xylophilus sp. GOD-11R]|uniref:iron-sulfur cluster carrier protein ApbC n=1 Tax=Xylophilus sp. GOD-11R TaxID=3089814 RepID=UPI00298D2C0C|nr:iron-sulfur cluster carrier protein ApbC [Xylophilus sp. GOD-11R]WPB55275.1 iron-sulfur cluster carrier protein ApbC [Xylophilus sp. GOD-11R]
MSTTPTDAQIRSAIASVIDPNTGAPLAPARALGGVTVAVDGAVRLAVELGYPAASQHAELAGLLERAVRTVPGVTGVDVAFEMKVIAHSVQRGLQPMPEVRNIVAVASGKGGVGKSTTAANLALALAAEGARVGLLDADIYGPSVPTMLGVAGQKPASTDGKSMDPIAAHGLQLISIGFLIEPDQAMIWRGPMATQALEQLLRQTNWKDLDYLVVDMPPGTGDIALTLSQRVPLAGAVIVTTPQDIALIDARKGVKMFEKVGVPLLGVVENMAVHVCSQCGHAEHIFGEGGGQRIAADYAMDYLGALPLSIAIRQQADGGTPTVAAEPDGANAAIYKAIARKVAVSIAGKGKDYSTRFPTIAVSSDT